MRNGRRRIHVQCPVKHFLPHVREDPKKRRKRFVSYKLTLARYELETKAKATQPSRSGASLWRTDPKGNALLGDLEQAALPEACVFHGKMASDSTA